MNADGTHQRRLLRERRQGQAAAWSPDGRTVAFFGFPKEVLYVSNAPGGSLRILARNVETDRPPQWSPDGSKILYERFTERSAIHVVDSAGTPRKLLVANGDEADWSPDGTEIVLLGDDGVQVVTLASGNVRRIATVAGYLESPAWSPRRP